MFHLVVRVGEQRHDGGDETEKLATEEADDGGDQVTPRPRHHFHLHAHWLKKEKVSGQSEGIYLKIQLGSFLVRPQLLVSHIYSMFGKFTSLHHI